MQLFRFRTLVVTRRARRTGGARARVLAGAAAPTSWSGTVGPGFTITLKKAASRFAC